MDVFDIESLFPQMVLALGAALLLGNGFALYQSHRGRTPGEGELHRGRAWFLLIVGLVIGVWGAASL